MFIKKIFLVFSCFMALSLSYAHSNVAPALMPGWESINQSLLKNEIAYLTSDHLQGRLSLSPGDQKAIDWITKQFENAGLKPAVGSTYLQLIKLIEYLPDSNKSYLILEQGNKKIQWIKPDVYTEFNKNITLTGQVVFTGFGITAPDLHYDDYQNMNVRGRIVLVFEHEPQESNPHSIFNGTANTLHAATRVKALNAQKHGAIAIIIAPEPNRNHPSNLERYARIGGSVKRKIPIPSQVLNNDELHIPIAIVSDSVARKIAGKNISLANLQMAIDQHLIPQSQILPDSYVTIHDENVYRRYGTTYNVIGLLEGSDPVLKQETIIISAHHDHEGINKAEIWHGADDNASGVAGVISLAKAYTVNSLAKNGIAPKRSILFVVFAGEERGLLGSLYMVNHPIRPLVSTRAMINFDMIGRNEAASKQTDSILKIPSDTTNRLNLIGNHYSLDYEKAVKKANESIGLTLDNRFDQDAILNVLFRSDQFPFLLHDIPAFWWFTGFHPDYHHTTDTAEKINYSKMEKIIRLAYLTGFEFANQADSPKFVKNPGPQSISYINHGV